MEMLMENFASSLFNSMAKSTIAAQMLAAVMDLSGVPLHMTLIKIRNMDFAHMNVSLIQSCKGIFNKKTFH